MTSTLKVNTLTGVSTAGSIAVTGEGNSTTTNLQQGLAKGFAAFNQASVTDSYNHSSCTDVGTGNYHPNLTNNMGVAEGYAVAISGIEDSGTGNLKVLTSQFNINNAANNEAIANFIENGAVEI